MSRISSQTDQILALLRTGYRTLECSLTFLSASVYDVDHDAYTMGLCLRGICFVSGTMQSALQTPLLALTLGACLARSRLATVPGNHLSYAI